MKIFKMNNRKKANDLMHCCNYNSVGRAQSTLSVSAVDYVLNLPNLSSPPSPTMSTVTLTPGRIRNIDQDMEALRASRQDNPFIQQVIASRESLVESLDEIESDDANLMAKEFSIVNYVDPLSLPEMHEHMIRSPPPITWPHSPNKRMFEFPNCEETLQVEITKAKDLKVKSKHTSWDGLENVSPHKSKSHGHHHHPDRFSLLSTTSLRATSEDSVRLMASED